MTRTMVLLVSVVLSACGNGQEAAAPDDTLDAPTTTTPIDVEPSTPSTSSTTGTSTPPSTSTTPTSTTNPATSTTSTTTRPDPLLPDDADCSTVEWLVPMTETGHVTVARDDALFDIDVSTGEHRCLARLDGTPTRLDWNPGGDRLLVDDETILAAEGPQPSGFERGTPGVSWSQPSGTAVIAPSADGSELLHVSAADPTDVVDVGALATTWAAAYHPSGLAIISAGIDDADRVGLFIADNRGERLQRLVFLDEPDTVITAVAVSADGTAVAFIHDHTTGAHGEVAAHVHRLRIPELWIEDLATLDETVPAGLVASDRFDGAFGWTEPGGDAGGLGWVWRPDDIELRAAVATERSAVVGFVGDATAVELISHDGSAGGDVWLTAADGARVLVASGVSAATTRIIRPDNWQEPPLDIVLEAVG